MAMFHRITLCMFLICALEFSQTDELPGPGTLRSLNKRVTSSSQHPDTRFLVSHAVDGSTRRDSAQCNCCATTIQENDPWIQIDLGRLYRVAKVEIIGRTDYVDPFNMAIFVSTKNTSWQGNTPTQPTLPDVPEQYHNVTFSYPVIGQFVTLQLNGNVLLCVCEVNIYSKDCSNGSYGLFCNETCGQCQDGEACDHVTGRCTRCRTGYELPRCTKVPDTLISLNANVSASSIHKDPKFALSRAVDGSTKTESGTCACCAASDREDQPWIQIDLGRLYRVAKVEVVSRTDWAWLTYFAGMRIYIHEKRDHWTVNHALVRTVPNDETRYYNTTFDNPVIAQFVTLQIPINDSILIVCEVSVFSSFCSNGTYGLYCNETCGQCQKGETCDNVTGICGQCHPGYQSPLCTKECLHGSFGSNCSSPCHCQGNGTCDRVNGSCPNGVCELGWRGSNCSQKCPTGTYGLKCNQTCGRCQDNQSCNHVTGNCAQCPPGYQFPLCKENCSPSFYGPFCNKSCGQCQNEETCDPVTGSCKRCRPGYQSPSCIDKCPPGRFGHDCASGCNCHKDQTCHHVTGECPDHICDVGWMGLNCSTGIIRLNAAAGMQVSMSSVHAGMDATRAIDGQFVDDPETCGCCSETTNEYSSWWQVDLGRPFFLKKVILYGRLNENVFRQLVGFSILTSLTNEFPDNPVHNQNGEIQYSKVVVLLPDVAARYVRIQRLGILTICEVELVQSDIICPTYTYGRDCTPCGPCRNGSCDRVTGDCPSGCFDGYEGNMCEKLTVHKSTYNDVIIGVIGAGVGVVTSLLVVALIVALFRYKKRRIRIYEEPSVIWAKEPTKESAYASLENQEIVIEKEETYDNPI